MNVCLTLVSSCYLLCKISGQIILWYHCIQEVLEIKLFSLEKIHTDENGLAMMTKAMSVTKMNCFRKKADMVEQLLSA